VNVDRAKDVDDQAPAPEDRFVPRDRPSCPSAARGRLPGAHDLQIDPDVAAVDDDVAAGVLPTVAPAAVIDLDADGRWRSTFRRPGRVT
jgi:hypothetical protein